MNKESEYADREIRNIRKSRNSGCDIIMQWYNIRGLVSSQLWIIINSYTSGLSKYSALAITFQIGFCSIPEPLSSYALTSHFMNSATWEIA
jgi:hypothetical protein